MDLGYKPTPAAPSAVLNGRRAARGSELDLLSAERCGKNLKRGISRRRGQQSRRLQCFLPRNARELLHTKATKDAKGAHVRVMSSLTPPRDGGRKGQIKRAASRARRKGCSMKGPPPLSRALEPALWGCAPNTQTRLGTLRIKCVRDAVCTGSRLIPCQD